MARNIRWIGSFKSQNGTSCTVNIYSEDWPAGVTMGITLAADPFYFQEENSSDLLNNVMRYRTGYIRVVEQNTFGSLNDIYPTAIFDRYVEVLYGSTIVFNGYIQVQDFSSELVSAPRILEFPVISPLGLFEKRTFSNTLYLPPSEVSLGALLDQALISTPYSYVYIPKNFGYPNPVTLGLKVSTLVVTPWNEDFHYSMNVAPYNKVAKGQTYAYIVEAICKAFGWICHDTPSALVFTAFDYDGTYCYYPVGHIGDSDYSSDASISSSAEDLTDYFTASDNDANEETLMPDTGIEISYDGEYGDRTFSFDRATVPDTNPVIIMPSFAPVGDVYPDHAETFSLCSLIPVPTLGETNVYGTFTFDNNDKLSVGTHCVAWDGQTGIMVSLGSYESGRELFWVRFYLRKRSNQKFSLSYNMKLRNDGSLGGLSLNPDNNTDYYITTAIDYSHDNYVQVAFKYRWSNVQGSQYPQLNSQALIFISNIRLEVCEQGVPYAEYLYKPASDSDVIPSTGNPSISSEINMPISLYRLNDHLIGTSVRSTMLTEYPYLFQPRKNLTSKFRITSILDLPHARKFSYMGKNWRVIAQNFKPWDDEYELTLQSSPIL